MGASLLALAKSIYYHFKGILTEKGKLKVKTICPQHIFQSDAGYNEAISRVEGLKRENQEVLEVVG